MRIKKLDNGNLLVPQRIEDNDLLGDAIIEVTPDDSEYKKYLEHLTNMSLKIKERL